jgi:hypothetical protein
MKNLKALFLLVTLVAIANVGAFAQQSAPASVPMSATVATSFTITMTSTSVNFGSTLIPGATSDTQEVDFNFAGNAPADIYVYTESVNALTGSASSVNIPATDLKWSATYGGTYAAFASIDSVISGAYGAKVFANEAASDSTDKTTYLQLSVPSANSAAPADDYSGTLWVKALPKA